MQDIPEYILRILTITEIFVILIIIRRCIMFNLGDCGYYILLFYFVFCKLTFHKLYVILYLISQKHIISKNLIEILYENIEIILQKYI